MTIENKWKNGKTGKEFSVECSDTIQVGLDEYNHFWVELMGEKYKHGLYYSERLIEHHLIEKAVYIKDFSGWVSTSIPCGKHRVSGLFDLDVNMFDEEEVIRILKNNDGFPNPRIESFHDGKGKTINFLVWGKTPRARDLKGNVPHRKFGKDLGYKEEEIEKFCKEMNFKG